MLQLRTESSQSWQSLTQSAVMCRKGILLIDDDPDFCKIFGAIARSMEIPVTTAGSLTELFSFALLKEYDLVVVDYHLEDLRGVEIAEYIEIFFPHLPVVLISADEADNLQEEAWPGVIRKFVNKSFGPYAILQRALMILKDQEPETTVRHAAQP